MRERYVTFSPILWRRPEGKNCSKRSRDGTSVAQEDRWARRYLTRVDETSVTKEG